MKDDRPNQPTAQKTLKELLADNEKLFKTLFREREINRVWSEAVSATLKWKEWTLLKTAQEKVLKLQKFGS